eukprot:8462892-Pyramimonas_sp.AAC.1
MSHALCVYKLGGGCDSCAYQLRCRPHFVDVRSTSAANPRRTSSHVFVLYSGETRAPHDGINVPTVQTDEIKVGTRSYDTDPLL